MKELVTIDGNRFELISEYPLAEQQKFQAIENIRKQLGYNYNRETLNLDNGVQSLTVKCQDVTVQAQLDICSWIQNNGGIHPLPVANISTLTAAYLGFANVGFSMVGHVSYISGAVAYYLYPNTPSIGNSLTGCNFN